MNRTPLSIPEIALIGGTRAMLGAGVALLLTDEFRNRDQRRAVGWTLFSIGAITTIPILAQIIRSKRPYEGESAGTASNRSATISSSPAADRWTGSTRPSKTAWPASAAAR